MTATATRKRTKKHDEEEAQAQALKAFDAIPPADGEVVDAEFSVTADEPTTIAADVETIVEDAIIRGLEGDADDEHRLAKAFREVAEMNGKCTQAFQAWRQADEVAKAKKKAYEASVIELREFIWHTQNPAAMPLFDGTLASADDQADDEDSPTQEVNPPDDAWRNMPLREALPELSKTIHDKLEGAQLFTMGELANWTAENGGRRRLTDIAGIGSAASGKIEEATMAFWQRQGRTMAKTDAAEDPRAEYLSRPLPWGIGLIDELPADVSKFQTIGDLEKYAASVGLSIFDTLRNIGLSSINADKVLGWIDEERKDVTNGGY